VNNQEKFVKAFAEGLQIPEDRVVDTLMFNSIKEWDSVAHMQLVAELEDTYHIMLDTNDIIAISSVAKARDVLRKYDVEF
jgi:acyl carrier protein